jgi:hypothetical protein
MKLYDQVHLPQILVSIIHAVISTQGSIRYVFQFPFTADLYLTKITPVMTVKVDDMLLFYLEIAIGYFAYDLLVYCLDFQHVSNIQIFHHILAIIAYCVCVYTYVGSWGAICLQTNEISTPFLHFRYLLKTFEYNSSILYKICEVLFVILFVLNRIIWNLWIWGVSWWSAFTRKADFPLWNKSFQLTSCSLHVILQLIWFWEIVKMVTRKTPPIKKGD